MVGSKTSTKAVRRPIDNMPINKFLGWEITCNFKTINAMEAVSVTICSSIGFQIGGNQRIHHLGPAAIYFGEAPGKVADWDGSGEQWFKMKSYWTYLVSTYSPV